MVAALTATTSRPLAPRNGSRAARFEGCRPAFFHLDAQDVVVALYTAVHRRHALDGVINEHRRVA